VAQHACEDGRVAQAGLGVNFLSGHGDDALADNCTRIVGIAGYDNISRFVIGKQLKRINGRVRCVMGRQEQNAPAWND
jgi:hypothetical protein